MRIRILELGVVWIGSVVGAGCHGDVVSTPGAAVDASTPGTGSATLMIDDMEHADEGHILKVDGRNGFWVTTNDAASGTTQWPAAGPSAIAYDAPGVHGSSKAIHTYGATDPQGAWGAAVAAIFRYENGTIPAYDASKYGGISFWAKSNTPPLIVWFGVSDTRVAEPAFGGACVGSQCGDAFGASVPVAASWEPHVYSWCQLRQQGFGIPEKELLVPALTDVTFGVHPGVSFDLWVDDLAFLPGPASPCDDGGPVAVPTRDAEDFCAGPATEDLIDDMTGPSIAFAPPSCATKGNWWIAGSGTITTPVVANSFQQSCGSLCANLYSPLPPGFPGTISLPDAGSAASDAGGGAPGPMAMCMAGTTPATLYAGAGMFLQLGYSGGPDGGYLLSDGGINPNVPLPALVDASSYSGVQFWLWVSPDTVAAVSPALNISLADKNETAGFGVCDESASGVTACGAGMAAPGSSNWQGAGPIFGGDGAAVTALSAGWQLIRIPWASFVSSIWVGGANEDVVDPTALTDIDFWVGQELSTATGGAPVTYDYCVYQLSFYK